MPNWCEGKLKVRGEKEDIKRFLLEGLEPLNSTEHIAKLLGKEVPEVSVEIEEDEYDMTLTTKEGFYIKGSRRNFIDSQSITWYFEEGSGILVLDNYRSAWCIDTEALRVLSDEYKLDMKIYAFEKGMEYNLDFEVHKGNIIKCDEITFSDYRWECIDPELGG